MSTNIGIGYRKLSENKNSITGANVFLDYDEEFMDYGIDYDPSDYWFSKEKIQ